MSWGPVDEWLEAERDYAIEGVYLRPLEHPAMAGMPLQSQRGQATAYFVRASDQTDWILKKFHRASEPDRIYTVTIARLLPFVSGFESGCLRQVLDASTLRQVPGGLADWLDGVVMMPRVKGVDWANLADRLRGGKLVLDLSQRMALGRGLAALVSVLETSGIAHRDLSSGNLMIDAATLTVHLIDWDSLFHASLAMPANTTCGSHGYIPPFVKGSDAVNAALTWNSRGDRFALALLCVEFLVIEAGTALAGDGGMFPQDQVSLRSGPAIELARNRLRASAPAALPLFDSALAARSCADCPPPEAWLVALQPSPTAPPLSAIPEIPEDEFMVFQTRVRPASRMGAGPPLPPEPDFDPASISRNGRFVSPPPVAGRPAQCPFSAGTVPVPPPPPPSSPLAPSACPPSSAPSLPSDPWVTP